MGILLNLLRRHLCPDPIVVRAETVHGLVMDVMILDEIPIPSIERALAMIPNYIGFRLIPDDPSQYTMMDSGEWSGFMHPVEGRDKLIVVFDGDTRGCRVDGGALLSGRMVHRVGVAWRRRDTTMVMGLRIYHEMLHVIGQTRRSDIPDAHRLADQMTSNPGFEDWLPREMRAAFIEEKAILGHSPYWQLLYYHYLLLRLSQ